jgi:hypothetical protein
MALHAAIARSISLGLLTVRAPVDHPRTNDDALARDDRERPAAEVAEHVDRELRSVEVLLHNRIGHVLQEELELTPRADGKRADGTAAGAGLDEQWERDVARDVRGQKRPRRRDTCCPQVLARRVFVVAQHVGRLRRARHAHAVADESVPRGREDRELVVDRGHDEPPVLGLTDRPDLVEITRVGRHRHAIGPIGDVHSRRERVHVGHNHNAGQTQRAQRGAKALNERGPAVNRLTRGR